MELSVNVFVSLDGIVQGPGAPGEDRSGGFGRGGWLVPHASVHTNEVVEGWFREADAFLFGGTPPRKEARVCCPAAPYR